MTRYLVEQMAAIFAAVARIESMKAENEARRSLNDAQAYGADAFMQEADLLDQIRRDIEVADDYDV